MATTFSSINRAGDTSFIVNSNNLIRVTITSHCESSKSPHEIEFFLRPEIPITAVVVLSCQDLLGIVEENILVPWSESLVVDFRFYKYSITVLNLIDLPGADEWFPKTSQIVLGFNMGPRLLFAKNIIGKSPMPDNPERYFGDCSTVGYQVNLLDCNKPKRLLMKGHHYPMGTQNIESVSFNTVRELLLSGLQIGTNSYSFYFPMLGYFRPVISVVVEGTRATATARKKGLFN